MSEPILNLAAWIDRRRKDVGPYADHIIHSVRSYESNITALQAENARLLEALVESRDEIDAYIKQEYPLDNPVHDRYRQRDFAANPARAALNHTEEKDT